MAPGFLSDEIDPKIDAIEVLKDKLDREFIEALDRLFPEKTPELEDSLDTIRYRSGQRSVVHLLRSLL